MVITFTTAWTGLENALRWGNKNWHNFVQSYTQVVRQGRIKIVYTMQFQHIQIFNYHQVAIPVVFERNNSFSRMTSCNYWKVIPQFVPLTSLYKDIGVLRIVSVEAECVHSFVQ